MLPSTTKATVPPVGWDEETFAVRLTTPPAIELDGTFTLELVKVMDVGTGPLPPLPPPPPADPPPQLTKPRKKMRQKARYARGARRLRQCQAGSKKKSRSAAKEATGNLQRKRGVAKWGRSGSELVVVLEEGAKVEIIRVAVAAVLLPRLTVVLGEKLHEIPAGGP